MPRYRRPTPIPFVLTLLFASGPAASGVLAQDRNIPFTVDYIMERLLEEPVAILNIAQARPLIDGDRSAQVYLGREGDNRVPVAAKWKPVHRPGEGFNNEPRYEVAAYRLQALFLDEPEYVVPPTVLRAMPVEGYLGLRDTERPTIQGTRSRLFLLSYWVSEVTNRDPWDARRFEADSVYARHWGNLNILTHLIEHKDANTGNLLISTDPTNPRVFAVDNDIAFRSRVSDQGDDWRRLHVNRLPAHTVERLRKLDRETLVRELAVVAEFLIEDGYLVATEPGPNLRPDRGVRVQDDRVQFGLTEREIQDVWQRLERLLNDVDRGRIRVF